MKREEKSGTNLAEASQRTYVVIYARKEIHVKFAAIILTRLQLQPLQLPKRFLLPFHLLLFKSAVNVVQ